MRQLILIVIFLASCLFFTALYLMLIFGLDKKVLSGEWVAFFMIFMVLVIIGALIMISMEVK